MHKWRGTLLRSTMVIAPENSPTPHTKLIFQILYNAYHLMCELLATAHMLNKTIIVQVGIISVGLALLD